jgi:hypothetical protein
VNNIVIDSTDAYKAMLGNLAFTLALYSGQMCTTSQAIFVPAGGIDTEDGHKSYDEVCADLARAVERFLSKPEVALAVLGAMQSADTAEAHRDEADSGALGKVVLASTKLDNPEFPKSKCAPRCCSPATPPTRRPTWKSASARSASSSRSPTPLPPSRSPSVMVRTHGALTAGASTPPGRT